MNISHDKSNVFKLESCCIVYCLDGCMVGLIGLVTNGSVEGITGVSHKNCSRKISHERQKVGNKSSYIGSGLTGDRLAECA